MNKVTENVIVKAHKDSVYKWPLSDITSTEIIDEYCPKELGMKWEWDCGDRRDCCENCWHMAVTRELKEDMDENGNG